MGFNIKTIFDLREEVEDRTTDAETEKTEETAKSS